MLPRTPSKQIFHERSLGYVGGACQRHELKISTAQLIPAAQQRPKRCNRCNTLEGIYGVSFCLPPSSLSPNMLASQIITTLDNNDRRSGSRPPLPATPRVSSCAAPCPTLDLSASSADVLLGLRRPTSCSMSMAELHTRRRFTGKTFGSGEN